MVVLPEPLGPSRPKTSPRGHVQRHVLEGVDLAVVEGADDIERLDGEIGHGAKSRESRCRRRTADMRENRYLLLWLFRRAEIAQVRAATDIVALITEYVALKKSGRRWQGLCPFHGEKSPSFSVNAEEGRYYCFGCRASGDQITFVREMQHLDFVDAVRLLADRAGIELHEDDASPARRARSVRSSSPRWTRPSSGTTIDCSIPPTRDRARDYLRVAGYQWRGGSTVPARLGARRMGRAHAAPSSSPRRCSRAPVWASSTSARPPPRRAACATDLSDLRSVGQGHRGGRADLAGDPARAPRPDGRVEAKYKNSPETPIYSKRRTLYALNWAKDDIIKSGEIIVCEGYTDVIAFFAADMPRAVATCGTALGEEHFRTMRNFANRIVLAYDADQAGQSAAASVYQWESQHEVDVARREAAQRQ